MSFLKKARPEESLKQETVAVKESGRIGEVLREWNILSDRDIEIIATEQKATGGRFGEVALKLGLVTESQITKVLAHQAGVEYFDLRSGDLDVDAAQHISAQESREHEILPLSRRADGTLLVGVTEPTNTKKKDKARHLLRGNIEFVAIERSDLFLVQSRIFQELNFQKKAEELAEQVSKEKENTALSGSKVLVPKLVSSIVWDALANRASDIHMICTGDVFRVLYRISGVLKYMYAFPPELYSRVAAQVKGAAGIEQGDKLHTADGTWDFDAGSRVVNIRVSKIPITPAPDGESLVLRVLDQNRVSLNLDTLGFYPEDVERLKEICRDPYGMALCTGPTGSGKTTTLYSLLSTLRAFDTNILTIENPVEYKIPGIRQMQVNERAGITFPSALRNFLRQDPDVILVGEIRDQETAKIAVQSAITGHLVLSTLHTNDAPSSIPRLLTYEVDPTALQSSLSCVIAQRLVRKVCRHCSEERPLTERERRLFSRHKVDPPESVRDPVPELAKRCKFCQDGFTVPTIIYELLFVDSDIRRMLKPDADTEDIRQLALEKGMVTMLQCGLRKVAEGVTTLSEVQRVTRG